MLDVVEVEPRPEVLVPEEDEDGDGGESDEHSRDALVGEGGRIHDEVLLAGAGQDAAVGGLQGGVNQVESVGKGEESIREM